MPSDKIENKIKKKHKFLKIWILVLFLFILAIIGIRSDYFNIKQVIVKDNNIVSKDEIIILSQSKGKNIFLINKDEIKKKVCNNPYIEYISIKRKFPSIIIISVKEKEIKGIIKVKDGFINVDNNGRMVQLIDKFPSGKIPLIEGVDVKQYVPNQSIVQNNEYKQKALLSAISVTNYNECKSLFYSINIYDPYNIVYTTKNGIQVKIGDWTNIEYKISYAIEILHNTALKGKKGYIQIQPDGLAVFRKN